MNREEIMAIITHRDPILLVDEAGSMIPDESIVCKYYVEPEMDVLKGHFPGMPVFPGVYSTECMGQAACIMLMTAERYRGKAPLLLSTDKLKFKKKVAPGDTLEIRVSLVSERADKAIANFSGEIFVNGEVVVTGDVALAMR